MGEHSDEFEREVIDAVRELRGTVRAIKILIGIGAALALLVLVAGLVNVFVGGGDSGGIPGNDVHAALEKGTSASVRTEAGLDVTVTITSVTVSDQRVQVGTKVRGTDGGNWYLYLASNQRVPMQGSDSAGYTDGWKVQGYDGEIPAGERVRFVQFGPDDSRGDLYFDVNR